MKASMIATGLLAAALVGTAGVRYVAFAARPQDADKIATPKRDDQDPGKDAAATPPESIETGRNPGVAPGSNLRPGASSSRVLWARLNSRGGQSPIARSPASGGPRRVQPGLRGPEARSRPSRPS